MLSERIRAETRLQAERWMERLAEEERRHTQISRQMNGGIMCYLMRAEMMQRYSSAEVTERREGWVDEGNGGKESGRRGREGRLEV